MEPQASYDVHLEDDDLHDETSYIHKQYTVPTKWWNKNGDFCIEKLQTKRLYA